MGRTTELKDKTIDRLLQNRQPGFSLPAEFYNSEAVFQLDTTSILLRSWIYACHQSELPKPGDFRLLEFAGESVIVVCTTEWDIRAHINVCRHRGSRVCLETPGNSKNLVCPYHGWAYNLQGQLIAAREMPKGFDRAQFGLKPVSVSVVYGLVFVNFDTEAPPLEELCRPLDDAVENYDIADTKVAYQRVWNVSANWKLALENYLECYHCAPAHKEYSQGHSLKFLRKLIDKLREEHYPRCDELGIYRERIFVAGDDAGHVLTDVYHSRYPLLEGYVTGSEDGKPLAPLLGRIPAYDGGASDLQFGTFNHALVYSDHMVIYSFLPQSSQSTDMKIVWLVRSGAEEGVDYDVDRLTWLWRVTTDADKTIILNNQHGVNSRYYEPGPYSEMEDYTSAFVEWYLDRLRET